MALFHVREIEWLEGEGLPTAASVECESSRDIADALSDTYGCLVKGFVVESG